MVFEEASQGISGSNDGYPYDTEASNGREGSLFETSTELHSDHVTIKYHPPKGSNREYQIPFDRMPVQGAARAAAWGNQLKANTTGSRIAITLMTSEKLLGRSVTQAEAEGLALHHSRTQIYTQTIPFVTFSVAAFLTWRTRRTFKFPLRKPKAVSEYDHFPSQRTSLLTGTTARGMWHLARFVSNAALSSVIVNLFIMSTALNAQRSHMGRDDRTKKLRQELHNKAFAVFVNLPVEQAQSKESSGQSSNDGSQPASQSPSFPEQTMENSSLPSFGDDGQQEPQHDSLAGDSSPSSAGSAWGRLRQSAKSNSGNTFPPTSASQKDDGPVQQSRSPFSDGRQSWPRGPQEGSSRASTRSRYEEDRAQPRKETEQERAQKEFDRMLEAERDGAGLNGDNDRAGWGGKDLN